MPLVFADARGLWLVLWLVGIFGASFGLSLWLTPRVRQSALRLGIVDHPQGALKTHAAPVAYLGGMAVYLAFLLTLCAVFAFDAQLLGVLLGATLMAMLGLVDDVRALPPAAKLVGQLLACLVLFRAGIWIQLSMLNAPLGVALTVLWVVGITNAINILDVSDGLATSSTCMAALGLAAMCALNGNMTLTATSLALAGALLGFARYNWAPASIYLGDTGSLFIGATLAAISLIAEYTERSVWGALSPIAFLVTPILDVCLVTVARLAQGKNPLLGSPDHLALRLKAAGWTSRQVAWGGAVLSAWGTALGLGLSQARGAWPLRLAALGVTTFVALGVWLWHKPPPTIQKAPSPPAAGL